MNFWKLLRWAAALVVAVVALLAAWLAPVDPQPQPLRPGIEIRP